jgi:hypothetical protein
MSNGVKMLELEIATIQERMQQDSNLLMAKMQDLASAKALIKKPWKPEYKETYYYLNSVGEINTAEYDIITMNHERRIKIGNCFKTEELAKRKQFELVFHERLEAYALEYNPEEIDWSDGNQKKYLVYYVHGVNKIEVTPCSAAQYSGVVYFTSEEVARNAMLLFKDEFNRLFLEVR